MSNATESATRLRRLDALFAEKVLRCVVEWTKGDDATPMCSCPLVNRGKPHGDRVYLDGFPNANLASYTRSLDAAWEGAERYDWFRVTRQLIANGGQCCVEIEHSEFPRLGQATCPHPAEALVIAALRAVGVPESDLV